eukprot:SAG11_NODE_9210_length_933_cov_0.800959_1_plen_28_part_01
MFHALNRRTVVAQIIAVLRVTTLFQPSG